MKGPFERLKYDLRRVWECPACRHKERVDGTVTTVVCRCQAAKDPLERVVMKLIEDRIQRRLPAFVPPVEQAEEAETPAVAVPVDGAATSDGEASSGEPSPPEEPHSE